MGKSSTRDIKVGDYVRLNSEAQDVLIKEGTHRRVFPYAKVIEIQSKKCTLDREIIEAKRYQVDKVHTYWLEIANKYNTKLGKILYRDKTPQQ